MDTREKSASEKVAEASTECYNGENTKGWLRNMKKYIALALVLAVISALLCGCGMIIVEDSQPVEIGWEFSDRSLTERC